MSWKSLFFNENDEVKGKDPVPSSNQNISQPVPQPVPVQNTEGVINTDLLQSLIQVLDEYNLPGPDYLEVRKADESLKQVISDGNTRFIAAFNTIKATSPSLTKSIMMESIEKYIKRVLEERITFNKEVETFNKTEIEMRQAQIDENKAKIEENQKMIASLIEQNTTLESKNNEIGKQKQESQIRMEIQKKNFDITLDAFLSSLNSDKEKINNLIQ